MYRIKFFHQESKLLFSYDLLLFRYILALLTALLALNQNKMLTSTQRRILHLISLSMAVFALSIGLYMRHDRLNTPLDFPERTIQLVEQLPADSIYVQEISLGVPD